VTARWHAALGFALTGCELELRETGGPDPQALVDGLEEAGWPASRVDAHARGQVAAGLPWPHPVSGRLRSGCGAAQLAAALQDARDALGLTSFEVRPPSGRSRLDPDEERLMREVPPHHGS